MITLLKHGRFTSTSGLRLPYKIECDHFALDDWQEIAKCVQEFYPIFKMVIGVPNGGLKLQSALEPFTIQHKRAKVLYIDDVWTTGNSMRKYGFTSDDLGFVVFARGKLPENVKALFYTDEQYE